MNSLYRVCRLRIMLAAVGLAFSAGPAAALQSPGWIDPSPHRMLSVAVDPRVQLEVLDWGGNGQAMVFLAGLSNTAHSFDAFALRFRDAYHVYGITRRGFGASSHPEGGYDSATRAHDILAVLDSLGIDRAVLVGHSIAGDELSKFAVEYPDRVRALVYLDAYSYGPDPTVEPPLPPQAAGPAMTATDSASAATVVAYWTRRYGIRALEAEVRAVSRFAPTGRLEDFLAPSARGQVYAGTERSDYPHIAAPALAIYATHRSAQELFPALAGFDDENRRMARDYFTALQQYQAAQIARFRAEVRRGTIVEIQGANHFLHYSNGDDVERAMRAFLAGIGLVGG